MSERSQQLKRRFEVAWRRQDDWSGQIDDAYRYAMPHRADRTRTGEKEGDPDRSLIYDDTAVLAVPRFASRLQGLLTPPYQKHFELTGGPAIPKDQQAEVEKQLAPVTETVQQVLHSGPFISMFHEAYQDLATGRCTVMLQAGPDPDQRVLATCVPRQQVAVEEGPSGRIERHYRKRKVKLADIGGLWPDAKPGPAVQLKIDEDTEHKEEIELWESCTWNAEKKKAEYSVIAPDHLSDPPMVDQERRRSPYKSARWMKNAGEHDGTGPLLSVLPTIRVVNKVMEMTLKAAALGVAGVYTGVNDGVLQPAQVRLVPHAIIPVHRNGGPLGPSLQPLQTGRDYDLSQIVLADHRETIRRALLDTRLPDTQQAVRSATEILERVKELNLDAGPGFGRAVSELLIPVIEDVIDILVDVGDMLLPQSFTIDNLFVRAKITGQLAQVQRVENVERSVNWMQMLQQLLGREAMILGAKVEDVPSLLAHDMDVPQEYVRSAEERSAMQQIVGQMIAQGQQQPLEAMAGEGEQPDGA